MINNQMRSTKNREAYCKIARGGSPLANHEQ